MPVIQGLGHSLLLLTPQYLLLITVLVVTLVRWRRHSGASALAFAGALVLLVELTASTTFYTWFPNSAWYQSMSSASWSSSLTSPSVERFYDIVAVIDNFFNAVGLGLCFLGVFVGRKKAEAAAFPVQPIPMASRMAQVPPPLPPGQWQ